MLLNFIRLDDFKATILPYFTVEVFEPSKVVRRDDAMSTKKPSPGGAARAFCLAVQGQQIFSITLVFDR